MSKRDVARMWVQEITGGRKPRLCIEKGEDNLVVVATFESTNHSKYFEEIIHEMCEELKRYRAIGTVSEFRELKEENAELHCEMQAIGANMDLLEKEIRTKAIEEFAEKMKELFKHIKVADSVIDMVVKEMKGE